MTTEIPDMYKDVMPDGKDPMVYSYIESIEKSSYIFYKEGLTEEEKYLATKELLDQAKLSLFEKLKDVNFGWNELSINQ